MVSKAKGRGRAPAPRRNTDTISNTGQKLKQLHESALTLLYFTKTMSAWRMKLATNRQADTPSWYRYGNLNSQRSHKSRKAMKIGQHHAAQEPTAWRVVSGILAMKTGVRQRQTQQVLCAVVSIVLFFVNVEAANDAVMWCQCLSVYIQVSWIIATRPTCSRIARIIFSFNRAVTRSNEVAE